MTDLSLDKKNFTFEEGRPKSRLYNESYYGSIDGLNESRHFFLDGNGLGENYVQTSKSVVAETGFGTGLNLLALLQRRSTWKVQSPLHYISVEAHPLSKSNFEACHHNWTELEPWRHQLSETWTEPSTGWHRLDMKDSTLTIDIFHGTASEWFKNFPSKSVDHWFLDGFSPARNPEMWTEELFSSMADFSMNGSTLASFTSAGFVRRGLGQVGFSMNRTKGYGKKREMLVGSFGDAPAESSVTTT